MTPEFALKLCSDFLPVRNKETGKIACTHKVADLCMHPQHFLCELVLYKNRTQKRDEREDGADALSTSRVSVLEDCARKFGFIYDYHAFASGEAVPEWKVVGTIFTTGRAKIDMNLDKGFEVKLEGDHLFAKAKVKAALDYYKEHPPYEVCSVTCEDEIYVSRDNWWFHGYLDALTLDGNTIREWKYAGGKYTILKLVRQAAVYFLGTKAKEFELWRFPKPSHRPSCESLKDFAKRIKLKPEKDEEAERYLARAYLETGEKPIPENAEEFYQRVRKELFKTPPAEMYDVVKVSRGDVPVQNVIRQMIARYKTLPVLKDKGYPPSYGMGCDSCDYRKPCEKGLSKTTEEIAAIIKAGPMLEAIGKDNELTT